MARSLLGTAALLALCGCGSHAHSRVTVRDSAGIRIVENRAPAWSSSTTWRLAKRPSLEIGVAEGDPHYELSQVTGAVRLPDGGIVIADMGSDQLRFYDAHGHFLRATGRRGRGPGEFVFLFQPVFARDSLWTLDYGLQRISVFDTAGHFARSFTLNEYTDGSMGVFADGSILVSHPRVERRRTNTGVYTSMETLNRISPSGALVHSMGVFPFGQSYVKLLPDGHRAVLSYPFGRQSALAVAGATFYFGTAETYQIGVYSESGRLESLIRRAVPPRRVTSKDMDAIIRRAESHAPDAAARRALAADFRNAPHAPVKPAYSSFRLDALGDLWVGHYLWAGSSTRWTVFGPRGRMLGDVTVPPRFRIYQIGPHYVLGMRLDSLGVERVVVYALKKP